MKILVCFSLCLCTVYGANVIQKATSLGANTLVDLIHKAGLTSTLANGGPFTVFAPSDQAFAAVPQEILQKLQSDKALLQKVLKYHVVSGMHYADEANNELIVPSLVPGLNIRVNIYQGGQVATVEGSKVVLTNQNASNGVIHVLDRVMYPLPDNTLLQYVASQPNLSQLVYSVIRADLQAELAGGPFTLFAPVDSAFDKLPAGFLSDNFLTLDSSRHGISLKLFTDYSGITSLKQNGKLITDTKEKFDALNRQFNQSVFSEPNKITATEFENNQYMQQKTAYPTMPDINITIQGISKLLLNLKSSKASGPDELTPRLLRELAHEISPIVCLIYPKLDTGRKSLTDCVLHMFHPSTKRFKV
ncbi:Hypothetical predicted protein [Mytilus galloprovincialis]|uniref:FAS1 domain-containing protein n=1 Tax=Mytilus galloprovincialis TaxID=29158 RepID=A0A8B6BTY4_MYTGA|nr:Hypothetical predicted protein [Mytilus galloprovincialis]